MVSLPGLDAYTEKQLAEARVLSPAFALYEQLLRDLKPNDVHSIRHASWLRCVAATFFNTASSEEICLHWSQTADVLLQRMWCECGLEEAHAVLFTLGKQGAMELNLSSDIDLLVVAEAAHVLLVEKNLRLFQQRLQVAGEHGFCYRLDFDLRPGGRMGPRISTPAQFQDYYWSQGETWERLALVRLRAIVGEKKVQEQIEDLARRFSYRKFLDFTLLDDLKAMRSQVHQKGFVRREGELHLKLEVGGIRDIELFVHSLLVLNGGKIPTLQTRSTGAALRALKGARLLPDQEADFLIDSYWYFRHAENIVQAIEDRQTHALPTPPPKVPGLPSRKDLETRMHAVDRIVSSLLGEVDLETVRLPSETGTQVAWLQELGFSQGAIARAWEPLMQATALSHKNDRDERARQEFLYTFVVELARNLALDRDLGLNLLLDFVRATRAKATFFTMLLRSPRLIQDLARIFCLSPYLGSIVASRPELLDHFILQLDEGWSADLPTLLQQMTDRKLLTELWAANQFLADKDLPAMFTRISETADSICIELLMNLRCEFPDSQLEIIALGKWAGRELGLRSDLDFIFVTPSAPQLVDFKVARRMISRLTDPSKGGSLYDLDLRLRPSGQSGPLLVAVDKLVDYWRHTAEPWERQAYLRARPLNMRTLEMELLTTPGLNVDQLAQLKDIRCKLLRPTSENFIDIKYAPGGLLDIEFVAQTALLTARLAPQASSTLGMIEQLAQSLPPWQAAQEDLKHSYLYLREFEQMLQLSSAQKTAESRYASAPFAKAAALLGRTPKAAWQGLCNQLESSRHLLNQLDPTGLKI